MELLRQLAAIALVFGLLAAALWALRRRGLLPRTGFLRARKAAGRLEAIERLALSPQHTLHLVRVADRALLIGAHSGGCTLLESMPLQAHRPKGPGGKMKRLLLAGLVLAHSALAAAPNIPLGTGKGATLSLPMQIVLLLTLMTLLPAVIMSVTPFLRIVVVLHFLRQALGTQSTPSNQVLIGLALFLAILIIQPVAMEVYTKGWEPVEKGQLTPAQGFEEGSKPLKAFLGRFAREKDVRLLIELTHRPAPRTPADLDLAVLVPAYILSELKAAFQIGAVLFLPFLIIDLVVASVTLSAGMIQLPPVMLSAPFKLLLFVLADGWNLVVGSLVKSFY